MKESYFGGILPHTVTLTVKIVSNPTFVHDTLMHYHTKFYEEELSG